MSSAQVDPATKLDKPNKKENDKSRKPFNTVNKKHKHDDNRHHKFSRKRLQSYNVNGKCPLAKRRKKDLFCKDMVLPTKFLLGGSISDPLNLNSLQDEEVNRALNAVTPKSSPLPIPTYRKGTIEVIIPPNICDPLNLSNCNDNEEYEKQLISPTKKSSKKRNRKKKRTLSFNSTNNQVSEVTEGNDKVVHEKKEDVESGKVEVESQSIPAESSSPLKESAKEPKVESQVKDKSKLRLKVFEEPKDKRLRKLDVMDRIVSPVVPQPGAWKTRFLHRPNQDNKKKPQQTPKFKPKDAQFQYGNYNRYYGYRNSQHEVDTRLKAFAQRKELFYDKDVLDIGCNIGHITLSVGRDFSPRSVTGIDIDRNLIKIARKNIKHYVNCVQSPISTEDGANTKDTDVNFFPMSMPINYGPIDVPGFMKDKSHKGFPYNVTFVQGNYVLDDDSLSLEQPQFDVLLCLSTTKWIHLNFGDEGMKQSFKRMFAQLRPGGVLILEPQSWTSYGKKKTRTERIFKNYHNIKFFPTDFTPYLLSSEVGFSKCDIITNSPHPSKGFQRSLYLYTKASSVTETSTYVPVSGYGQSDLYCPTYSQRSVESYQLFEFDRDYNSPTAPPHTSNDPNCCNVNGDRSPSESPQFDYPQVSPNDEPVEKMENAMSSNENPSNDT